MESMGEITLLIRRHWNKEGRGGDRHRQDTNLPTMMDSLIGIGLERQSPNDVWENNEDERKKHSQGRNNIIEAKYVIVKNIVKMLALQRKPYHCRGASPEIQNRDISGLE